MIISKLYYSTILCMALSHHLYRNCFLEMPLEATETSLFSLCDWPEIFVVAVIFIVITNISFSNKSHKCSGSATAQSTILYPRRMESDLQ